MSRVRYRYVSRKTVGSLTSHSMLSGMSGSGKSNALEHIAMEYKRRGWKVFDIYDSGRFENHLYSFEEQNPQKLRLLHTYTRGRLRPEKHASSIIWIVGRGLDAYDRLPASVQLRSLSSSDLRIHDMMMLFGETDARKSMLAEIELAKGQISFTEAKQYLKRYLSSRSYMRNQAMALIHRIMRWQTSGMFSEGVPHLDMLAEAQKRDVVTSFCTVCLDPEEEAIVYSLILRKLLELKRKRLIPHRVLLCFREVSVMTDEMKDIPAWGAALSSMLRVLRQGRDYGIDLITDCQRESDLPPKLRRQFGYHYFMRTNRKEREIIEEVQSVPPETLENISGLGVGQCIMVTGSQWEYPIQIPPTSHRHKVPGMDVLMMLGERDGWQKPDMEAIFGGLEAPEWQEPEKSQDAQEEESERALCRADARRYLRIHGANAKHGWKTARARLLGFNASHYREEARRIEASWGASGPDAAKESPANAPMPHPVPYIKQATRRKQRSRLNLNIRRQRRGGPG